MTSELKPCPFCGTEAHLTETRYSSRSLYTADCKNEDCQIGTDIPEEAIAAWNRRPAEAALAECERERNEFRERLRTPANPDADWNNAQLWTDQLEAYRNLERKLAAAREAMASFAATAQRFSGENWERSVVRDLSIGEWRNLATVFAALTEVGTRQCKWTYSEGEEYYDTECGKAFQLSNEHSLASNGFRFCCYCGAALTEADEQR